MDEDVMARNCLIGAGGFFTLAASQITTLLAILSRH
jgi:hypothetical protein